MEVLCPSGEIEKFAHDPIDVLDDLPQERGSDISPLMVGHGGLTTIGMLELAMRALLTYHFKSMPSEKTHDFLGFENGISPHGFQTFTVWVPMNSASN